MADPPLDAYAKPPAQIRDVYKTYQRIKLTEVDEDRGLLQFDAASGLPTIADARLQPCSSLSPAIRQIFLDFMQHPTDNALDQAPDGVAESKVYETTDIPGLLIYPNLFPPDVQLSLLDRLLHRDLTSPQHRTNVHLHRHVPYPPNGHSFFHPSASQLTFCPKDAQIHKPLSLQQFLSKKLRWTTLGGQYDWTAKVYPSEPPPEFPGDIKALLDNTFPMKAEAAIVNLYSPGDTLSLHRDVSEECNRPLVSISLGCDAIFICGVESQYTQGDPRVAALRLRSGDAVVMSGQSRYAWHGVPKILENTCPEWMEAWPAIGSDGSSNKPSQTQYECWRGWMKSKRVNLNVRQMFA